jgi:hypothetical protein
MVDIESESLCDLGTELLTQSGGVICENGGLVAGA